MNYSRSLSLFSILTALQFLTCPIATHADEPATEGLLIRNVLLFDPDGEDDDKIVNILIRENKVDRVTENKISRQDALTVVNAHGGILLGKVDPGTLPDFLIFNQDPRDIDVLMDTEEYTVFVVKQGVVIKNLLGRVVAVDEAEEPSDFVWKPYTPPPVVIPLSYKDKKPWNYFDSKWVNGLFIGIAALDRMWWLTQNEQSEQQVGDLNFYDGGEIRAFRFGLVGSIKFKKPWTYTLMLESHSFDKGFEVEDEDSISFTDWRLDIPILENIGMSVGKQKPPMSMERITSLVYIPMQERSAVSDTLMPSRKNGVAFNGFNEGNTTSLSIGAFNNWASNINRGFNDSETSLTGRFTWAPFISEDESNILHLGFAYSHTNGKEGFNFGATPEFNKSPVFVGTGEHDADKIQTYNLELYWRKDRLWLGGEYTRTKVSNPDLLNPTFDGYHLNASWVLTGKMRTYNKRNGVFRAIPVAKDVYEHGKGAWEIAMRYSDLDLNDGLVEGGDLQIFSAGLNWWLTTGFAFSLNYRYINNGQFDLDGNSTGLNARLLLMLN